MRTSSETRAEDRRVTGSERSDVGGSLVVVSGPSGVGKSTVVRALRQRMPGLAFSVSATTRRPREGEVNGRDYTFLSREEFQRRIDDGGFVEHAEVFGDLYGTPAEELARAEHEGRVLLLEIDVQGGIQVRRKYPGALAILLTAPTLQDIRSRLGGRGTETPEQVARRFAKAGEELRMARDSGAYDHEVVNDTVEKAVERIERLITAHRRSADDRSSEK